MDLQVGLKKILKQGVLNNELEFERASIIDRQLRLLVNEYPELAPDRERLRTIIKIYEDKHWANAEITDQQVAESGLAGAIAEQENSFNQERKRLIKLKLKQYGLTQKDLGTILGHTSET